METLKPCFACGGEMALVKKADGEYWAVCGTPGCNIEVEGQSANKRAAIRWCNQVADAPL